MHTHVNAIDMADHRGISDRNSQDVFFNPALAVKNH